MNAELPVLGNTEEAVRFGISMTPAQYLLCEGGRISLQREFDRIKEHHARFGDRVALQIMADLATTIGKMREAIECAPHSTLLAVHLQPCHRSQVTGH